MLRINKGRLLGMLLPESRFVYRKNATGRDLFLTFDDGPHPEVTPALLDLLAEYEVPASFFCIGRNIERFPEIARRIHAEGHALANHSFSHRGFRRLGLDRQMDEFARTETLLGEITGGKQHHFRAPQGHWNVRLLIKLMSLGVTCVHWTLDSQDCLREPPSDLADRLARSRLRPGEVLLFHDDADLSVRLLASLIPLWKDAGFTFARL